MLQWKPQKLPWVMVTHSTGRSERSSWRAMNSGWTSAQNSCSHSLSTSGSGRPAAASAASGRGMGWRASAAVGGRRPGSRASSSKRMVVPERAGPVTITGAVTGWRVISGAASMAAVSSRRARSERSSSCLVMSRPTRCMGAASMAVARASKRSCQRGSPRSPAGRPPRPAVAVSRRSPASMGTRSRGLPPTEPAMRLMRRTQSGRTSRSVIGVSFEDALISGLISGVNVAGPGIRPTRGAGSAVVGWCGPTMGAWLWPGCLEVRVDRG